MVRLRDDGVEDFEIAVGPPVQGVGLWKKLWISFLKKSEKNVEFALAKEGAFLVRLVTYYISVVCGSLAGGNATDGQNRPYLRAQKAFHRWL